MEDTHGVENKTTNWLTEEVLILIIMEDTHGEHRFILTSTTRLVLILIIMEDTHGATTGDQMVFRNEGLNPYYNGRYSWSSSNG